MRDIKITDYSKHNAKYGTVRQLPWDEFVGELTVPAQLGAPEDTSDGKILNMRKSHRCFIAGPVDETRLRLNENVLGWDVLCGDVDKADEDQMEAVLDFHQTYRSVLYTTHKNGAECLPEEERERVRLVVLLDKTVPPERCLETWNRLNVALGNSVDKSTKNIGRLNYYPSSFDTSNPDICWSSVSESSLPLALDDLPSLPIDRPPHLRVVSNDTYEEKLHKIVMGENRLPSTHNHKKAMKAVLKGERLGDSGERHAALLGITMLLAKWVPDFTHDDLAKFFEATLEVHKADTDRQIELEEITNPFDSYLLKIEATIPRLEPELTPDEMQKIADINGWKVSDISRRLIVTHEEATFFLGKDGRYGLPVIKSAPIKVISALEPFPCADTRRRTQNNDYIKRTLLDMSQDHGFVADVRQIDIARLHTYVDFEKRIIHEATAYRQIFDPFRDPLIDEYWNLLSGGRFEKMIDYMSVFYQLDRRLCAMVLLGDAGVGKSFFATALSYMFGGTCSNAKEVLAGKFSDTLPYVPIVFGDETLEGESAHQDMTAKLREVIGIEERMIQRKGQTTVKMFGCPRFILAANDEEDLFKVTGKMTPAKRDALAVRFTVFNPDIKTKNFLEGLSEKVRKAWKVGGIARHALWYEQNHTIKNPGLRFAVDGDGSELAEKLVSGNQWTSLIAQSIILAVGSHGFQRNLTKGLVGEFVVRGKNLYVRPEGVQPAWSFVEKTTHTKPERRTILKSLKNISYEKKVQVKWDGDNLQYYKINLEQLVKIGEELMLDMGAFRNTLKTDSKPSNKIGDK